MLWAPAIRDYIEDGIPDEDVNYTLLGKVKNMLISAAKRCLKIRRKISYKNETFIKQKMV